MTEVLKVLSGRVVSGLGSAEAQKFAARLITMIERTTEFTQLGPLAGALEAVVGGLVPTQAVEALKMVLGGLAPAEVQKVAVHLIATIERTTEPMHLSLTEALKAVPGELGPAEAQKILAQLITLMERFTEPKQDMALIVTLKAAPGKLY